MKISESERIEILNKHSIPQKYQDLYFSILYEDNSFLPKECLKDEIKDRRFPVDVVKIKKAKNELIILLAHALFKELNDE